MSNFINLSRLVYILILLIGGGLLVGIDHSVGEADVIEKNVLVLHSYHQGYKWVDNITEGINSVFSNQDKTTNIYIEYMDTKRVFDEEYTQRLVNVYTYKFSKHQPDAIIVSDNNALNFILQYGDTIFPEVPVVFCGINNFEDAMLGDKTHITGVVEVFGIKESFDFMRKINPQLKRIIIINDKTTTGIAVKNVLNDVISTYPKSVEFVFWEDDTINEVMDKVQNLSDDSVLYFGSFFRDAAGNYFNYDESIAMISEKSAVPIYGFWDFYLGHGLVGGMITSGYHQGKGAAELCYRILEGEQVKNIPIIRESPNKYMFDYHQMERFGIKISDLPQDHILLNPPITFFSKYKYYLLGTGLLIVILAAVIALSSGARIRQAEERKKILERTVNERTIQLQEKLAQVARLKTLIDTTVDLIAYSDLDGNIHYLNPAGQNMLGHTPEHFSDFQSSKTVPLDVVQDKGIWSAETTIRKSDGAEIPVHQVVMLLRDENHEKIGLGTIVRDIREQKEAEQKIKEKLQIIKDQQDVMMEMSTPVIQIWEEVLILPLIGTVDSSRASQVMHNLLDAITKKRAREVIIDITGVPLVDTEVANHLIKAIQAAKLVGAHCMLVGISADIAQTLVHIGIELNQITTFANLEDGLRNALQQLQYEVKSEKG